MNQEFDIETAANKTMDMLSVSAGQVICIWASTYSLDFVEALALRIRAQGAFWTLRLTMESLLQRIGRQVPEHHLALVPEHELRWLDDVDAIVELRDHGGHIPGVSLARRRAMAAEWIALIDEVARRGIRRVRVINPTPALAAAHRIPLPIMRRSVQRAIGVDYQLLDQQQARTAKRLAGASQVHITTPLGTDLRLRLGQRPIQLDKDDLPRGKVSVAPFEESAEGLAVIDRVFIKGTPVERLRLTFAQGRVVNIEAAEFAAIAAIRELMAASSGDKDILAEFGVGLNPGVTEPVGDVALDEKIAGSAHIAIGMNEHLGGKNRSDLRLGMVMLQPIIRLDGSILVADGVLSI